MRAFPWILGCLVHLAGMTGIGLAQHASASPAEQVFNVGDIQVEMGRPLRLALAVADQKALWQAAWQVAHAMSSGEPVPATTATTAPLCVELFWSDGTSRPARFRFLDGSCVVPVPAGRSRVAEFHVVWRSHDELFDLRVPAAPREFRARIVAPHASTIIDGTGSFSRCVFGDTVPVTVRIVDAAEVQAATILYRSERASRYQTCPMELTEGSAQAGCWRGRIPRPPGLEAVFEYYVEIVTRSGMRSNHGSADLPFKVQLLDPTAGR